ncbi:MAG: hypothetical protein NYU90_01705 [Aigarchaeota archaeon]|nr:hypothetical protein [Candidatus Calditenuis fumarioli]
MPGRRSLPGGKGGVPSGAGRVVDDRRADPPGVGLPGRTTTGSHAPPITVPGPGAYDGGLAIRGGGRALRYGDNRRFCSRCQQFIETDDVRCPLCSTMLRTKPRRRRFRTRYIQLTYISYEETKQTTFKAEWEEEEWEEEEDFEDEWEEEEFEEEWEEDEEGWVEDEDQMYWGDEPIPPIPID